MGNLNWTYFHHERSSLYLSFVFAPERLICITKTHALWGKTQPEGGEARRKERERQIQGSPFPPHVNISIHTYIHIYVCMDVFKN